MPDYAVYGIHFYGTALYGLPPRFEFSLDYFVADPVGYDRIKVGWGHPSGAWDRLRLVRGNYGFPMDQTEGRLLLEVTDPAADPQTYEDHLIAPLRFHYYSMFLRQTTGGNWVRAGNAVTLMPKDFGYTDRLYELVPGVLRDDDIYVSSSTDQGMLQTYIGLFGYSVDKLRSDLESLRWTTDPERMSLGLLPYLAEQLGFPYEAELGGDLARRQMLKAVYAYKYKGTKLGVEAAANVLTGWVAEAYADTPIHVSLTLRANRVNEILNPGAEVNTASWTAGTNTTLSRVTTQHLYGTAAFQLAATAGGDISMSTAAGTSGMPVIEGGLYTASAYNTKPSGTARNLRADIIWYDQAGAVIGSPVLGTEVAQVVGSWANRPAVSAVAPSGAKTAAVKVTVVAAGAGEQQFFDGAMFGPGGLADYFDGSTVMSGTPIADYLWEGSVNNSRSHYYHRRAVKNSRLVTRLPDFLPSGMTFTPLYAQPLVPV